MILKGLYLGVVPVYVDMEEQTVSPRGPISSLFFNIGDLLFTVFAFPAKLFGIEIVPPILVTGVADD